MVGKPRRCVSPKNLFWRTSRKPLMRTLSNRVRCLLAGSALFLAPVVQAQPPDPFGERYYQLPPGSSPGPGITARDLTAQLFQETRRLVDDVNYELAGTSQGYQAGAQVVALAEMVEDCHQLAWRYPGDSAKVRTAVLRLEPALRALQATLHNPPGAAPTACRGLFRINRLYGDLRQLTGVDRGPGIGPGIPLPPGIGGPSPARQAAQQLADDITQTQLQLQASGLANYNPYNRVARDLVSLGATVQEVVGMIDQRIPPTVVLGELQNVQARADRIEGVLRNDPNLPPAVGQCWGQVLRDLGRLAAIVGNIPDPGRPPLIPTTIIVPPIVQPPPVVPPLPPAYGGPLALLDDWLGALDQLIAVQQANVTAVPQGFQVLGDARELRSSLGRLRQRVGAGVPPPGFQGAFREVERDYGRLRQRIDRIAGGRSGPNIDLVRSMQGILEQIRAYSFQ